MKMMHGADRFAALNNSTTAFSPDPRHTSNRSGSGSESGLGSGSGLGLESGSGSGSGSG